MGVVGRRRAALCLAAAALAGLAYAVASHAPAEGWLVEAETRLRRFGGVEGVMLFAGLFVLCALVMVPTSGFALLAGLLYGAFGIPLAWLCMMTAGALSILLARHLLAGAVEGAIARRRTLRVLRGVIEEEGWRVVLLVRVSGIVPFGLQNYLFGLTSVRFGPYLLATALGILPSILVYAGFGALGRAATMREADPPGGWRIALLAAAVAAGAWLAALMARRLREKLREPEPPAG